MEKPQTAFSLISFAEYDNRRLDKDGERLRLNELLEPDIDFDPTQPNDRQRILQGYATNPELQRYNKAVTFLASVISVQSDELFMRNKIDFHVLSASLGTTGLRAVSYLREDYRFPAVLDDQPASYWHVTGSPLPIDVRLSPGRPQQHITEGFFTYWPSQDDLRRLVTDGTRRPR